MLSIMLSQFNVCIDDLNPARREVNRIMWYCVCSQISTADGQFGKPARLRRNRLILTPKGGLVVGIRDLCSVWAHSAAFRFSVRSKLTTYLVKASFHTRREPRCFRRDRLILTPKSGLVVGIRDLCSVYARFGPIRQRSASAFGQLPYCEHNVHTCRWMS